MDPAVPGLIALYEGITRPEGRKLRREVDLRMASEAFGVVKIASGQPTDSGAR
jgi:hypothetical protein